MSTTTYLSAQEAAKAMLAALVHQKGKDGAQKTRLADSASQWMRDTVRKIHDAREFDDPDDFKYDAIDYYLGALTDSEESEWDAFDIDAVADSFGDDGSYRWLCTSSYRLSYLDEVRKDARTMLSALDRAQLLEHREIFKLLVSALRAQVESKPVAKASAKAPAAKRTTKKTKASAVA